MHLGHRPPTARLRLVARIHLKKGNGVLQVPSTEDYGESRLLMDRIDLAVMMNTARNLGPSRTGLYWKSYFDIRKICQTNRRPAHFPDSIPGWYTGPRNGESPAHGS